MTILKIVIAGFLVFLNIFSFLLVKAQKNDREKKILRGIAQGRADNIDFDEKNKKPSKEEQDSAMKTLEDEENDKDESVLTDTENEIPKDKDEKKEETTRILEKFSKKPVSDLKLFLCAVLGGSLGIYIALFVFRYRLRDLSMMVLVPTILVLNIYFYLQLFTVWILLPFKNAAAAITALLK